MTQHISRMISKMRKCSKPFPDKTRGQAHQTHWRHPLEALVLLHPEGTPFQGLPQYHHHGPLWHHLQDIPQSHHCRLHHLNHLGAHLCHHHNQYLSQEGLHHPEISLDHSHNLSLSLLQYQILTVGRYSEPPHQICPQVTTQCQITGSSLSTDTLQAEETAKPTTPVNPLCASDVAGTAIQNFTAKTAKFPAHTARARSMPPIAVHSSQEPHQPQMVRPPTLLALMDEASEHTCQICSAGRKRSPKIRRNKREHAQQPQAQQNDWCSHSTIPGGQKYTATPTRTTTLFLPTTPTTSNKYLSMVRLWCSRILAWPLCSDRWLNYISNTLRQAKLRQKLSRTSPVLHPSHPQ